MNKFIVRNGSTEVEFVDLATAERYAATNNVPTSQIDQVDYTTSSMDREAEFSKLISAGYTVPNTTCSLALYEEDRAIFSTMLTLVNESLALGQMTTESQVSIKCLDDSILYMSAIEYKTLMMRYGFYYKTLWDQKNFS